MRKAEARAIWRWANVAGGDSLSYAELRRLADRCDVQYDRNFAPYYGKLCGVFGVSPERSSRQKKEQAHDGVLDRETFMHTMLNSHRDREDFFTKGKFRLVPQSGIMVLCC